MSLLDLQMLPSYLFCVIQSLNFAGVNFCRIFFPNSWECYFMNALVLSSSRKIKSFIISLFRGYKFVGDGYPLKSIKSFFVLESLKLHIRPI